MKRYMFESVFGREGLTGEDWGYETKEAEERVQNEKVRSGYDK